MSEAKKVICCRCDLVILDDESMIVLPPQSTQPVSAPGMIGTKTFTTEQFRHGDSTLCIYRLKREARRAWELVGEVRLLISNWPKVEVDR